MQAPARLLAVTAHAACCGTAALLRVEPAGSIRDPISTLMTSLVDSVQTHTGGAGKQAVREAKQHKCAMDLFIAVNAA
jgi:hypothetical protein